MKKSELKKLHLVERDQAFKKKALAKVITQKIKSTQVEIREISLRNEIFHEENSIYYYEKIKDFLEKLNVNLKYKPISNKGNEFIFKTNMEDELNQNLINLISEICYLNLVEYTEKENAKLHIIESDIHGDWPKAKCIHYAKTNSYLEMLQDYQPSHILFYPVSSNDIVEGHCAFGIYLMDGDYNFLCKQVIEIFDEKIASDDCKNLRIPKRASELLRGD